MSRSFLVIAACAVHWLLPSDTWADESDTQALLSSMTALFAAARGQPESKLHGLRLNAAHNGNSAYFAYQSALDALSQKRYDDAMEASLLWQTLEPESDQAHTVYALAMWKKGQRKRALERLHTRMLNSKRAVKNNLKLLISMLGRYHAQAESLDFFQSLLTRLELPDNDRFALHTRLAVRLNQTDAALTTLEQALEQRHMNHLDWYHDLSKRFHKHTRAIAFLEQLASRLEETSPKPLRAQLDFTRARLLQDTQEPNRRSQALEVLERLIQYQPNHSEALFQAAVLRFQNEDLEGAKRYFLQHIHLSATASQSTAFNLGLIAMRQHVPLEAQLWFERIEHGTLLFDATLYRARILRAAGEPAQALALVAKLKPETPAQWRDWFTLSRSLQLQLEQKSAALATAEFVLQKIPGDISVLYDAGLIASEIPRLDLAEAFFRSILVRQPQHADALNALGYTICTLSDRYLEALMLIEQAHRLEPHSAAIIDSLGWAMFKLKRVDESLALLSDAYTRQPGAEIGAHLAEVLHTLGDKKRAKSILLHALELDADNPVWLETALRLMPELVL